MISGSGALKLRAVAGRPSVTKLTHSSWTGIRASGRPSAAVRKMHTTSPMLEEIRYLREQRYWEMQELREHSFILGMLILHVFQVGLKI